MQRIKAFSTLVVALMLSAGLFACAPEPEPGKAPEASPGLTPNSIGRWNDGQREEGHQLEGEKTDTSEGSGSYLGGRDPVEVEKTQELPATFPLDIVPIPQGAVIDDSGERSSTEWFVVVRTASLGEATDMVKRIIADGNFAVESEEVNDDGGVSQQLKSERARVQSFTFTGDGNGFVNLEVQLLG